MSKRPSVIFKVSQLGIGMLHVKVPETILFALSNLLSFKFPLIEYALRMLLPKLPRQLLFVANKIVLTPELFS